MTGLAELLPYLVAGWLLLIGLYGVATTRHLIHAVLSLSVVHSAVWVLLIAVGYQRGATAPLVDGEATGAPSADPVTQALAVTDVVVGAAVTALLLAFAVQIDKRFGTLDPDELRLMRG